MSKNDFKTIIAGGEDMLKAAATASGESLALARERTRETAAAADEYVRGNPWGVAGIALAAGALLGYLAARK